MTVQAQQYHIVRGVRLEIDRKVLPIRMRNHVEFAELRLICVAADDAHVAVRAQIEWVTCITGTLHRMKQCVRIVMVEWS